MTCKRVRAHTHALPPPAPTNPNTSSSLAPSPGAGSAGSGLRRRIFRHFSLCKRTNREHNGAAGHREDGMGEHAAFLLLLAATLTLSSEVSLVEKPQPVAANRYLGQTLMPP